MQDEQGGHHLPQLAASPKKIITALGCSEPELEVAGPSGMQIGHGETATATGS
jgi:hypothetical protein